MADTDFFDDDLVKQPPLSRAGTGMADVSSSAKTASPAHRDSNLAKMARHREQLETQVASTLQEIERLRQRQEDFDMERRRLEDLRTKQDEYVRSKRDVLQKLHQNLLVLEKEEVRASQMAELYGATRSTFKSMLKEIEEIDESSWDPEDQQEDLTRAQDLVAAVRVETSKHLAKLDAFSGAVPASFTSADGTGKATSDTSGSPNRPSFGSAVTYGFALAIPFAILLIIGTVAAWAIIQVLAAQP